MQSFEQQERKTDLRVIKTRAVIKNALAELMGEKELSKISISEISQRAKVNRKTFYRHYRNVEDVIADIENEILDEFSAAFKNSVLDVGKIIHSLSKVIERRRDFFTRIMARNPDIFSSGKIKAVLRRMIIAALRNSGAVKDENVLGASSEYIISGVLALFSGWFENGGDLEFITDIAVKMVKGGLSSISEKPF